MWKEVKTIWIEVIACSLIWGLVPVGIKLVEGSPLNIGLIRLALALPIFLLVPQLFQSLRKAKKKDLPTFLLLGLMFFLHWACYFYSIQISNPTTAVLGLSTYGIHLMILSILFLNRKPRGIDILALTLSLAGVAAVVPDFKLTNDTNVGLFFGVLGGFFFAVLPIIHKKNRHIDDMVRTFLMLLVAFSLFLVSSTTQVWYVDISRDWKWFLFLGTIGTFISHSLWTRVSTYFSPNLTGILYYMFIPVTMFWSWTILSESPGLDKIIGALLIFVGGVLAVWRMESDQT